MVFPTLLSPTMVIIWGSRPGPGRHARAPWRRAFPALDRLFAVLRAADHAWHVEQLGFFDFGVAEDAHGVALLTKLSASCCRLSALSRQLSVVRYHSRIPKSRSQKPAWIPSPIRQSEALTEVFGNTLLQSSSLSPRPPGSRGSFVLRDHFFPRSSAQRKPALCTRDSAGRPVRKALVAWAAK